MYSVKGVKNLKKVFILSQGHLYGDNRVIKTVEALKGHAKIYYQFSGDLSEIRETNDIVLISTKRVEEHKKNSQILEILKNTDYDILYSHDIHFQDGIDIIADCKRKNATLIIDFHEYLPASYPVNFRENAILGNYATEFVERIFEKYLRLSDKIIVPSELFKKYLFEKYNISKPCLVVENYANKYINKIKSYEERRKEVVFPARYPRDIEHFKDYIEKMKSLGITFTILGMDTGEKVARKLGVNYIPFLQYDQMLQYLSNVLFVWISYIPIFYHEEINFRFSNPNKFADALAAGTPVIVSENLEQLTDYVEKYNFGIVLRESNSNFIKELSNLVSRENYIEILNNVAEYRQKWIMDEVKLENIRKFILY